MLKRIGHITDVKGIYNFICVSGDDIVRLEHFFTSKKHCLEDISPHSQPFKFLLNFVIIIKIWFNKNILNTSGKVNVNGNEYGYTVVSRMLKFLN